MTKKTKYSLEWFKEHAIKHGGKCLSEEYLNRKSDMAVSSQ